MFYVQIFVIASCMNLFCFELPCQFSPILGLCLQGVFLRRLRRKFSLQPRETNLIYCYAYLLSILQVGFGLFEFFVGVLSAARY